MGSVLKFPGTPAKEEYQNPIEREGRPDKGFRKMVAWRSWESDQQLRLDEVDGIMSASR